MKCQIYNNKTEIAVEAAGGISMWHLCLASQTPKNSARQRQLH